MSKANRINTINMTKVLRTIWENPGISRVEIARALNLDKSTITKIVPPLLENHLVKITEEGKSGPSGGRKPLKMEIDREFGAIAGIEIQTRSYVVVIINIEGEILFSQQREFNIGDRTLSEVAWNIINEIRPITDLLKLPLIGIGFGISGIINPGRGILYQSIPLGIPDKEYVYDYLKQKTNLPILIENDANCCTWGELVQRKDKRSENYLCVLSEFRKTYASKNEHQGIAIGMGFVINGAVLHGDGFSAGEFQSILWRDNNITQFSIPDEEASIVTSDPEIAKKVFKELSMHIALLVNTLNLTEVIIFGALEQYEELFTPILKQEIIRNWPYQDDVRCKIRYALHGDNSIAFGAAANLLENFYTLPDFAPPEEDALPVGMDLVRIILDELETES